MKKNGEKRQMDPNDSHIIQLMSIEKTRQENAECLSHGHNDGEHHWAEFFDGGKDEQLSD